MSRSAARPLLVALAAAAFASSAGALPRVELATDPASASVPFVRVFRDSDGLPHNTLHALALDAEGILWAGTQDGLASYDGVRWRRESPPGLSGALFVRDLLRTGDGSLWVASQAHGLLRRADGGWVAVESPPEGLVGERVNALAETGGGEGRTLWVGTHDHGLFAFDGRSWRHFGEAEGLPAARVWSLLADGGSRLWIGSQRGVARLDVERGTIDRPPGAPLASVSSLELTRGRGGAVLWAGTYGDGLHRYDSGGWTRLGAEDGLPSMFVTDLERRLENPSELWIATDGGGIAWADATSVHAFEVGPDLASRAAYRLLETTEAEGGEALWVGSRNGGLLRVTERLWRTVKPPSETLSVPVTALLVAPSPLGGDELWVGTDGEGLALWRGGEWRRFGRATGELGEDVVFALCETRAVGEGRRIWVGTRNGGVDAWDGEGWRHFGAADGALPSDLVQALVEVPSPGGAELWVGTREGVAIFDGRSWRQPSSTSGWPRASIVALAVDTAVSPTAVWIGTAEGLWRAQGGSLRSWGAAEGLPHPTAQALHLRRTGGRRELWIGTDGGGLALLDPDRLAAPLRRAPDPAVPELPNPVVYSLVEDAAGRLYAATNQGVTRFRPAADGVGGREDFLVLHGLPAHQGSEGAATVDGRGRIWIGTVGGVALLDPQRERRDTVANRVLLSAQVVGGVQRRLAPGDEVRSTEAEIVFGYRLLSFVGEPLNRYRTELAGRDRAATEWSALTEREIGGLAAGAYVFRVWGRDAAGNVSAPAELAFRVLPAPWQTWWARALAVVLVAGSGAGIAHYRARRHVLRERELERIVGERTAQLAAANEQLARLSFLDPLTGVANRRRFDEALEEEWRRAMRQGTPVALVMIDIDDFKPFNDTYGHPRGDEVLRRVADALGEALPRSGDLLARFGGEEFAVLLPATDLEGGASLAEQLRARVAAAGIEHGASRAARHVTVSCGVAAARPREAGSAAALVGTADGALYAAKRAGRDRVEVAKG